MSGYFLSAEAEEDLQDIFLYSAAEWAETQAERYLFALYALFEKIAASPEIGRPRPELGPGIRSFPLGAHVVFTMPWRGETAILRVLHGARDIEKEFSRTDPYRDPGAER